MSQVKGTIIVDADTGIVSIEVPERALGGLLRDAGFTAARGANGEVGMYRGQRDVPVRLIRREGKRGSLLK